MPATVVGRQVEIDQVFGKEIGAIFYNRGVQDAQQLVQQKAEDVVEALYGLERSVSIR